MPFVRLVFAFLLGCVSVIPALGGELVLHTENLAIEMFCNVALVEESVKLAVLMLFIWKHADFDDSFDAIVYSVTVSLGFAAVENIMYVIRGGLSVAIIRALFSIPGHASFAILMGVFFAKAKRHFHYGRRQQQYLNLFFALLTAVLTHGTYDYLAVSSTGSDRIAVWLLAFVVVLDIICIVIVHNASKNDSPLEQDDS